MVDRLLQATDLMSFCSCLIRLPETPINFLVDYTVISWDWGYSLFLFPFPIPNPISHPSSSRLTISVKKTRYVNLSKLHISSIFAIFLAFCFISATYFFKNFIISNFRAPTRVILMTKIISNLQLKPKGIQVTQVKGNK